MSGQLTFEQIEEYREAFDQLDQDGGGTISRDELATLLTSFSRTPPSKVELDRMIAAVDIDGSGTIDFDEFLKMMASLKGTHVAVEETLQEAFTTHAKSGDGYIKQSELKKLLVTLCEALDKEEVQALVDHCVANTKDGRVNAQVFIKSVTS